MGLFSGKASKINHSPSRGTRAGRRYRTKSAGRTPQTLEPLEGRQMYSVTPAMAIASEYYTTAYETDAYGNNMQALIGSATSGVMNDPYIAGAQMQTFHDGGAIYYSPATGAHLVMGGIGGEYAAMGKETNAYGGNAQATLGLPTSDEGNLAGFAGARTNSFQGGVIDWSPSTGAHPIYGGIYSEYKNVANETDAYGTPITSYLGLPTTDEGSMSGVSLGRVTQFQGGSIVWSPGTGAHAVYGGIGSLWNSDGGAGSFLGMPTSDEYGPQNDRVVNYQGGYISWSPGTGSVAHNTAVTMTTRYGDEAVITASGPHDTIVVNESGSTVTVSTVDNSFTFQAPAGGVYVYTRGGNDTVYVYGSVTTPVTVDTIDAAPSTVYIGDPTAVVWCDSTDSVTDVVAPGQVQRVSSFAYGTSKAVGASLPDPRDSGATFRPSLSLFGSGPVASDINQGAVGDCYFMATLSAVAQEHPEKIRDSVVDMGDGTYVVEMWNGNTVNFDRVSDDLPVNKWGGFVYAHPGPDNTLWGAIMEKAFCEFRSGSNTYSSISGGEPGEVFDKLHLGWNDVVPSNNSDNVLFARLSADMANHRAAVFCTNGSISSTNEQTKYGLIGDHCYSLVGVEQVNGVNEYIVRNPWGFSGDSLENSQGVAVLTYKQFCENFYDGNDMK